MNHDGVISSSSPPNLTQNKMVSEVSNQPNRIKYDYFQKNPN
jgi:hypothetical protein